MTECDRIIAEGILPREFLEPEVRCDFFVDKKRKKIWAVLLDMLLQVDRVCKKHGLRYSLAWGSMLGAVRHKGFIPWDDDLDVLMLRDDFEALMKLGHEFASPYFMQTVYNDRGYGFSYIKLRNSNTTYFAEHRCYWGFNCGLFLDIMPVDNARLDTADAIYDQVMEFNSYNSAFMKIPGYKMNDKGRALLRKHYGLTPVEAYEQMTRICMQHHDEKTDYIACSISSQTPWKKHMYRAESFRAEMPMEFEGFQFPVCTGYDEILTTLYGDYRTLPPLEKRLSGHDESIFEPDEPYKIHMKKRGVDIWD